MDSLVTLTGYLVAYTLLLIDKVFDVHDHCVMHDGSPSRYSVLNEVNLSGILNSFGLVTVLAFVRFDHPIMKDFPSLFLYLKSIFNIWPLQNTIKMYKKIRQKWQGSYLDHILENLILNRVN